VESDLLSDSSNDIEQAAEVVVASAAVRGLLELAREEDLGERGDITSAACIERDATGAAVLACREGGVVAGLRLVPLVLEVFAPKVRFDGLVSDGARVAPGTVLGKLRGPLLGLLAAERTLLNLVGRLSGIATLTARYVEAAAAAGGRALILDTRKTTPGLRVPEKYAVLCGGGRNYRMGLFDAALIKDNHLAGVPLGALAEFVDKAVKKARALAGPDTKAFFAEVEVDSLDQLRAILEAGGCGVDVVLLDNMDVPKLKAAVELRNRLSPRRRGARGENTGILLEASGGVTLETVGPIARTGVDRISVGALTHSAVSLDVGLDMGMG
jgi:nicotinate-nucleotide pyrophosphorylase (carboxylating)